MRFFSRKLAGLTLAICAMSVNSVSARETSLQTYRLDLPQSSLQDALEKFARETRRQVLVDANLIKGIQSNAILGIYTAEDALLSLIADSGLKLVIVDNTDFTLVPIAPERTEKASRPISDVETIIVTGTKRNRPIQEEIVSVSVFTPDDIEEQVIFNLNDILLRTSNVSTSGNSLNSLSIRGVQLTGVGDTGQGSTSNIYVDNSPQSFNANQSATLLWDVAQVEVLRGPQSTIQGRNALSGALIVNTADPEYYFDLSAKALIGNENQAQGSFMVNVPLVDDQVAFRLAADYREVDFEVINRSNSPAAGNNTRFQEAGTIRAKLLIEPEAIEDLRIELIANYAETDQGAFNTSTAPVQFGDPAIDEFDPFGNETFESNTRFESYEVQRYTLEISYNLNEHWSLIGIGTFEDANRRTDFGPGSFNDSDNTTYTAELRAVYEYGNISGWLGAYYYDFEDIIDFSFTAELDLFGIPTIPEGSTVTLLQNNTVETQNEAIFADLTYQLDDHWTFNIGARYDQEDVSSSDDSGSSSDPADCVFAPSFPGLGGLPCVLIFPTADEPDQEGDFSAFLPRASVKYDFDTLMSLSFQAARGYRAGGVYLFAAPGVEPETRSFDPEFLTNYEIAFRSQFPELNLTFNANVFYADWTDQQVTVTGPSQTILDADILNAGSSELYGVEAEAKLEISDTLDLFASIGLLKTKFKDFPFAVNADGTPVNSENPEFANLAGNEFNNAPNLNFSFGFSYSPLDDGFFINASAAYTEEQFGRIFNLAENTSDSLFIINTRLGYRFENIEVAVFANNLLDRRAVLNRRMTIVNSGTGAVAPETLASFAVNDPRLVGLEVKYNF
ncbi:MAG: TonB-dependent receptor [Pseudomonadota bacterium]